MEGNIIEYVELLQIKLENEQMTEGRDVIVSPLDKHLLHINEHKAVLFDPDLRRDPELVKVVLNHIEKHLNALRDSVPELKTCIHDYILYEGFTDRFYYCKRCDSKHRDNL